MTIVVKKVLRTLTPKWNHVAIIIEESKDLTALEFDHPIGSLMYHEERLREIFRENDEKPFASKMRISRREGVSRSEQAQRHGQNQNFTGVRGVATTDKGRGGVDQRRVQYHNFQRSTHKLL